MAQGREVIDHLECAQRKPDRRAPVDVTGQQRQQCFLHPQGVARPHEQVAHGRIGHAVDEPRELARAMAHALVETRQRPRRTRRITQTGIDRLGTKEGTLHGQHDPG
ncbi:hypothetical protein SDC9_169788 [bioreactor metagenome]|uniref:Uncharacterized protein n=1 Tax=bioreactor metagenome TaxID=1076179 RepID=A0A645G6Y0_9ZZZZ